MKAGFHLCLAIACFVIALLLFTKQRDTTYGLVMFAWNATCGLYQLALAVKNG